MKTRYLILATILILLLLVACAGQESQETSATEQTASQEPDAEEGTPTNGAEEASSADSEAIVVTRSPVATATPDAIDREVTEFVQTTGLTGTSFLGLAATDWINLAASLLIIGLAYIVGSLLTRVLIRWVTRRTSPEFGKVVRESIGPRLKWLIVIPSLHIATNRLVFVSASVKSILSDIYFVLAVILAALIVWTLINAGYSYYQKKYAAQGRGEELEPVLTLFRRALQTVIIGLAISIVFTRFGINLGALLAAFGVVGLAFSLAAQDTLADAISGFIILIDQPYRIGDRIEIQDEGTWGDVVEIGIRTTRIRTRDNRLVIVPNSVISKNQVVNYTHPDPRYRIQTHISIDYDSDIELVRQLIIDTVSQVEGVLPDKPVESLYIEMGDSAMVFRVRWWLESYEDTRRMFDRVNTALQNMFDANGIELPNPIRTTKLEVDDKTALNLSQAFRS